MAESELGAYWSGEKLLERGGDIFSNFDERRIDCNSYTLCVGDEYYTTSDGRQSLLRGATKKRLAAGEAFTIASGQFGFLLTKECVTIPNDAMAFISMRSRVKFRGLINVSGFHVDPGYNGKLIFSVFNAGPSPVHLCEGEGLFLIWFAALDRPSDKVRKKEGYLSIPNDLINGMSREVTSLSSLAESISNIKVNLRVQAIVFGFSATVFFAILAGGTFVIWEHGLVGLLRSSASELTVRPAQPDPLDGSAVSPPPPAETTSEQPSDGQAEQPE